MRKISNTQCDPCRFTGTLAIIVLNLPVWMISTIPIRIPPKRRPKRPSLCPSRSNPSHRRTTALSQLWILADRGHHWGHLRQFLPSAHRGRCGSSLTVTKATGIQYGHRKRIGGYLSTENAYSFHVWTAVRNCKYQIKVV